MRLPEPALFSTPFSGQEIRLARGGHDLLSPFSLSFQPGHLIHLQGGNGAGKSSLLRMLAGLLPAQSGFFSWGTQAVDLLSPFHRSQVSYAGPTPFLGDAQRLKKQSSWLKTWKLEALLTQRQLSEVSQGQRMRLHLASALNLARPLWLLDEPLSGLDLQGQSQLADVLSAHGARGGITVMASHTPLPLLEPDFRIHIKEKNL